MAKIFLDVGGHVGETLVEVLDPRYGFDRIHTFEPASVCVTRLRQFRDRRLTVHPFGLSDHSGTVTLHAPGTLGASVYTDKPVRSEFGDVAESILLHDAGGWFRSNLAPDDEIWVKLNCEGSEADVIERLHGEGMLGWITNLLLSLDVAKIPSQQHREAAMLSVLSDAGVQFRIRKAGMPLRQWLEPAATARPPSWQRIRFALGLHLPPREWAVRVGRAILPRRFFGALVRRFGQRLGRGSS